MPITSNEFQNVLYNCNKIWDGVLNGTSGEIKFLPDGTIYVFQNAPYNITQTCCNILRDRLSALTPPQYPNFVTPSDIYFDLNEQKCRWSNPPNDTCLIPDKEIKIVLNPVGNDGAFFTLTENDTCRLEIKFDYLFKIKCKTLEEVISSNPITLDKTTTDLRQEFFKKESELLDVNIQLEGLSKQAANTSYSIICDDFPSNEEVASSLPITEITQIQKLPFINTGFGSLTNNTELSVSNTKIAPIYKTKSVNFCLTDVGLISWRNIIGENNYVDFINGEANSYTCLDVIEIEKLNQDAIINNNEKLIFECTTPFGEKTNLLNKISELITIQKKLTNEISVINSRIIDIVDVVDPCSTMLGQFENLSATVTLDMIDENNQTTPNIFVSTFFGVENNLYAHLVNNQNNSGFLVCGEPTNNEPWASGCTSLVYPEFTFGDIVQDSSELNVSICNGVKDILYQELFGSSGVLTEQDFNESLSPNVFNSNWLTYVNTIEVTSGFTNNQIKLNIIVNGSCDNFCLLIDQISLTKVCEDSNRTNIFISQSPSFELTKIIDNKKSWVESDSFKERNFYIGKYDDSNKIRQTEYTVEDDRLILNSKEIDLTMNMASAVENDVWSYLLVNPNLLSGTTNLTPCIPTCGDNTLIISALTTTDINTANTLETFKNILVSELTDVKNRKILSGYPTLRALYDRYMNATQYGFMSSNEFDYKKMDEFTGLIKTYWNDLIEQVVPSTTIWGNVKVYTNTIFDQQKFKYRSYSTLLSENKFNGNIIPSPINGISGQCESVEVITTILTNKNKNIVYDSLCVAQMNVGSEFIGSVEIIDETKIFLNK